MNATTPRAGADRRLIRPRLVALSAAVIPLFAYAALTAGPTPAAPAKAEVPTLDEALAQRAPDILRYLKENGLTNVGVLKFRTRRGEKSPSDNHGPLNMRMAERVETALALALTEESGLRLLRECSKTLAEKEPPVNHLSDKGRRGLFTRSLRYQPAWGSPEEVRRGLEANAFLTGEVGIDPASAGLNVSLSVFDRSGKLTTSPQWTFSARGTAAVAAEAGVSFLIPRGRSLLKGTLQKAEPALPAESIAMPVTRMLVEAPVGLDILYNGAEVKVRDSDKAGGPVKAGEAYIAPPRQGQKVTFRLTHRGRGDPTTYGVVLWLNGQNTIFPDYPQPTPEDCYKWILEPGAKFSVPGYQTGPKAHKTFEVAPPAEAKSEAMRYGPHAGTITFVIFPTRPDDEGEATERPGDTKRVIGRGVLRACRVAPESLTSLQTSLRDAVKVEKKAADPTKLPPTRGLIRPGREAEGKVNEVAFTPARQSVASITIRYFKVD